MVGVLDSGVRGPGSSPALGHCIVFLDKTLNYHCHRIRSDEGLTFETSALEYLYGGQFTLSTQLISKTKLTIIVPFSAHLAGMHTPLLPFSFCFCFHNKHKQDTFGKQPYKIRVLIRVKNRASI